MNPKKIKPPIRPLLHLSLKLSPAPYSLSIWDCKDREIFFRSKLNLN